MNHFKVLMPPGGSLCSVNRTLARPLIEGAHSGTTEAREAASHKVDMGGRTFGGPRRIFVGSAGWLRRVRASRSIRGRRPAGFPAGGHVMAAESDLWDRHPERRRTAA